MSKKLYILVVSFVLLLMTFLSALSIQARAETSDNAKIKLILLSRFIKSKKAKIEVLASTPAPKTETVTDIRYKQDLNIDFLNDNQKILYQECRNAGIVDNAQMSNVFAQIELESGFIPKSEYRAGAWQTWLVNLQNRYWHTGFYGRGLIQLTWYGNYKKMGDLLNVDLVNNPELANDITNATKIACIGMKQGSFTGKKLDDYINNNMISYYQARRIVNSLDKASLVSDLSMAWYNKLTAQ